MGIRQFLGNGLDVVVVGYGDIGSDFRFAEGHDISAANPEHPSQRDTDHHSNCQPDGCGDDVGNT